MSQSHAVPTSPTGLVSSPAHSHGSIEPWGGTHDGTKQRNHDPLVSRPAVRCPRGGWQSCGRSRATPASPVIYFQHFSAKAGGA